MNIPQKKTAGFLPLSLEECFASLAPTFMILLFQWKIHDQFLAFICILCFPKLFHQLRKNQSFSVSLYLSVSLTLVFTRRMSLSFPLSFSFCLKCHPNVSSDALVLWVCEIASTKKTWKNNVIGREREIIPHNTKLSSSSSQPKRRRIILNFINNQKLDNQEKPCTKKTDESLISSPPENRKFAWKAHSQLHGNANLLDVSAILSEWIVSNSPQEKRNRRQRHRERTWGSMRERLECVCKNKTKQNKIKIAVSGNARQLSIRDRQQCGQSSIDNSVVDEPDRLRSSSSDGSPAALGMYYVTSKLLDEPKSKHVGLAQQNDFGPALFCTICSRW